MEQLKILELNKIAKAMVAPGKGILAADESFGTIEKKFAKINLPSTEENRRAYREMFFTAPDIGKYISGVIMFDETIRQSASDGRTFVSVLQEGGVLPGIKVDAGTESFEGSPEEKITKGLDGLPQRLIEYAKMGAKFAKWRAVVTIKNAELPTHANIKENAARLAKYAKFCQEAGIVPMVEPEVLMDGNHSLQRCEEVSEQTLKSLFAELEKNEVAIEGIILKTNMVLPGKESGEKAAAEQIAKATMEVFNKVLPKNLPGQAFLSGGQSETEATENLNAISGINSGPWQMSFSYGRALQDSALKAWQGKAENIKLAQEKFLHRAKMNSLARGGKYNSSMENN